MPVVRIALQGAAGHVRGNVAERQRRQEVAHLGELLRQTIVKLQALDAHRDLARELRAVGLSRCRCGRRACLARVAPCAPARR